MTDVAGGAKLGGPDGFAGGGRAARSADTPVQLSALKRLHTAATELEGVFLDMLFSAMRETVPQQSIFGEQSNGEQTFQTMLDEQRAQSMAQSGNLGIARVLENQLRHSVLSDAARESKTQIPGEVEP